MYVHDRYKTTALKTKRKKAIVKKTARCRTWSHRRSAARDHRAAGWVGNRGFPGSEQRSCRAGRGDDELPLLDGQYDNAELRGDAAI